VGSSLPPSSCVWRPSSLVLRSIRRSRRRRRRRHPLAAGRGVDKGRRTLRRPSLKASTAAFAFVAVELPPPPRRPPARRPHSGQARSSVGPRLLIGSLRGESLPPPIAGLPGFHAPRRGEGGGEGEGPTGGADERVPLFLTIPFLSLCFLFLFRGSQIISPPCFITATERKGRRRGRRRKHFHSVVSKRLFLQNYPSFSISLSQSEDQHARAVYLWTSGPSPRDTKRPNENRFLAVSPAFLTPRTPSTGKRPIPNKPARPFRQLGPPILDAGGASLGRSAAVRAVVLHSDNGPLPLSLPATDGNGKYEIPTAQHPFLLSRRGDKAEREARHKRRRRGKGPHRPSPYPVSCQ